MRIFLSAINSLPHPEQPLSGGRFFDPRGAAGDDGIGVDQELTGTGDEGDFVVFGLDEAGVESDEMRVPAEGTGQGGGVQALADAGAPAGDATQPLVATAVVVEGGQAGQSCDRFAREASQLRHPDEKRQCGAQADAGNAPDQLEAPGEVAIPADLGGEQLDLCAAPGHEALEFRLEQILLALAWGATSSRVLARRRLTPP